MLGLLPEILPMKWPLKWEERGRREAINLITAKIINAAKRRFSLRPAGSWSLSADPMAALCWNGLCVLGHRYNHCSMSLWSRGVERRLCCCGAWVFALRTKVTISWEVEGQCFSIQQRTLCRADLCTEVWTLSLCPSLFACLLALCIAKDKEGEKNK